MVDIPSTGGTVDETGWGTPQACSMTERTFQRRATAQEELTASLSALAHFCQGAQCVIRREASDGIST